MDNPPGSKPVSPVPSTRVGSATAAPLTVEQQMSRLTRRSFAVGGVAALLGAGGVAWLANARGQDGIPGPLRKMLEFNEGVAQRLFGPQRLAPEFSPDKIEEPRINGLIGLASVAPTQDWKIRVVGKVDRTIPLAAIEALPSFSMTTQLKCVEGWSRIINWKGARLSDVLAQFGAGSEYIGLSTPSGGTDKSGQPDRYYVGFDRPSALHPQTLLCYEMNGQPLTQDHGAPLRLISAVKYGYKCIKRIGVIELTDHRPPDYWAEQGYDWYAGH